MSVLNTKKDEKRSCTLHANVKPYQDVSFSCDALKMPLVLDDVKGQNTKHISKRIQIVMFKVKHDGTYWTISEYTSRKLYR